jgi:hypothetical protein
MQSRQIELLTILAEGCKKHPAYRARRRPGVECVPCAEMWEARAALNEIERIGVCEAQNPLGSLKGTPPPKGLERFDKRTGKERYYEDVVLPQMRWLIDNVDVSDLQPMPKPKTK